MFSYVCKVLFLSSFITTSLSLSFLTLSVDTEQDYKDFSAVQQNSHSAKVIVKWLVTNSDTTSPMFLPV